VSIFTSFLSLAGGVSVLYFNLFLDCWPCSGMAVLPMFYFIHKHI
jgi:hypothetical protein